MGVRGMHFGKADLGRPVLFVIRNRHILVEMQKRSESKWEETQDRKRASCLPAV